MQLQNPSLPAAASRLPSVPPRGWAPLRGAEQRAQLPGWAAFAGAWERLVRDPYLVAAEHARSRRYARFELHPASGRLRRLPHAAHYQSPEHNAVYGGLARVLEPIERAVVASPVFASLSRSWSRWLREAEGGAEPYLVEVHQMRCHAGAGDSLPTPEGMHRDGRDWVQMLLVDRVNVSGGASLVADPDGTLLDRRVLTEPASGLWIDDRRCLHGVEPIRRADPSVAGQRDTLIATFVRRHP